MIEIWQKVIIKLSIHKNWLWSHPQRNLILIIAGGLILAPVSFVISKETANKYFAKMNERGGVQVSEKVKEYADAHWPEINPSDQSSPNNSTSSASKSVSSNSRTTNSSTSTNESGSSGSNNNSNQSSNSDNSNNSNFNSNLPSCGSNYSFFTTSPLKEDDFTGLVPLGNLNPTGHVFPTDHIYFYIKSSGDNTANVPLYAPGDAQVTQISGSEHISDSFTDYSFTMQPCSDFKAQFGHVTSLSDKLNQALTAPYDWESTYSTGGKTYRMFSKNVSISVSAGEQIGTTGGNPGQSALDMNAYDNRVTLNFANSSRWKEKDTIHTVCPINYYSGNLKNTLLGRLGDYDGDPKRTQEPVCGTIEQDVAETAQGMWFIKGTSDSWQNEDPYLALVHNNIDPTRAVFSVGTSTNLGSGTYEFTPQSSGLVNRDFDDIRSDGNIYCFEPLYLGGSKIILQLPTSTTLKIEKQSDSCGSGPWSFTSSSSEFER